MDLGVMMLLAGGLGFLLYGVHVAASGLERVAQTQIKMALEATARWPIAGVALGFLMTALMQSSTAVSVMLVGFVKASLLTSSQALAVLLGSGLGTTVAVQLIAFRVTDYALVMVVPGVILRVFARRARVANLGSAILGSGLVFYGMGLILEAVEPMRSLPFFREVLVSVSGNPIQGILAAAAFAALVHSSAATVALVMALAIHGEISLAGALPLIVGANVGTTGTALVSSLAGSRESQRMALANVLFKVAGALLVLPLLGPWEQVIRFTASDPARQVAHAHTGFNLLVLAVLLPLAPFFSRLVRRILPGVPAERPVPLYLSEGVLDVPEVALGQVKKEVLRMADLVRRNLMSPLIPILKSGNPGFMARAEETEHTLDVLYRSIVTYLAQLSQKGLTPEASLEGVKLLYISNDLEHLGDTCMQMASISRKTQDWGMDLSKEGWIEIEDMYHQVEAGFDRAISALADGDTDMARRVIQDQPLVARLEKRLRYTHVLRIQEDVAASRDTSEIHMDLIYGLLRINQHSVSIAQAVMGII